MDRFFMYISFLVITLIFAGNVQAVDPHLGGDMVTVKKSSDGIDSAFPDPAETPSSEKQVPIPEPNTATSSETTKETKRVNAGRHPTTQKKLDLIQTDGDEPGVEGKPAADTIED